MKTSTNLKFQIPELDDQANVTVIGAALEALDNAVGDSLAMNGDASDAQVSFTKADSRSTLETKTTLSVLMGKIAKWLGDLKDAAFQSVANNLTTTASGYVLDARQGKALNDSVSKLTTQNGGLYFGKDSSGKWGYKESANGTVNPFRNPTGDAVAANVLVGKTFANDSSDSNTGTMPNNGSMTATLTPTGNNSVTKTIPAGYTAGGTITANGATAYAAGQKSAKHATISSTKTNVTHLYSWDWDLTSISGYKDLVLWQTLFPMLPSYYSMGSSDTADNTWRGKTDLLVWEWNPATGKLTATWTTGTSGIKYLGFVYGGPHASFTHSVELYYLN